jgi:hypothetical protein
MCPHHRNEEIPASNDAIIIEERSHHRGADPNTTHCPRHRHEEPSAIEKQIWVTRATHQHEE